MQSDDSCSKTRDSSRKRPSEGKRREGDEACTPWALLRPKHIRVKALLFVCIGRMYFG